MRKAHRNPAVSNQANSKEEQQNTQNALLVDIDLVCDSRPTSKDQEQYRSATPFRTWYLYLHDTKNKTNNQIFNKNIKQENYIGLNKKHAQNNGKYH